MSEQKIVIADADLRKGAEAGMDEFLKVFTDAYIAATGGVINAETMPLLNGMQHTLLGYHFFREEINEGGFIQLIQNGYGPYFFYEAKNIYDANRADLEKDCTDDEFMAMYEQYEAFDDLEEQFMDMEEEVTEVIARYVDEHLEEFAEIK